MRRTLLALSVFALFGLGLSACSDVSKRPKTAIRDASGSTSPASTAEPQAKDSNDLDEDPNSNDDSAIVDYGHAASPIEARTITALVKRYFEVAAAADGARACSMLLSTVAETVPEEYGQAPDPPDLHGKTCAIVMSKLFKLRHRYIAAHLPLLTVTRIRVEGQTGLVVMSLATTPEPHKISVGREGGAWKIKELLDSGMP